MNIGSQLDYKKVFDCRHKLRKHNEGEIFECHCGSVFKSKYTLATHQQTHKGEKVTCGACQHQFVNKFSLNTHWNAKHLKTHGAFDKNLRNVSKRLIKTCNKILLLNLAISINRKIAAQNWSVHL